MLALLDCSLKSLNKSLILAKWRVYNEDAFNRSMVRGLGPESIEIAIKGKNVSFDILSTRLELRAFLPANTLICWTAFDLNYSRMCEE
jgi:hypothetical protein